MGGSSFGVVAFGGLDVGEHYGLSRCVAGFRIRCWYVGIETDKSFSTCTDESINSADILCSPVYSVELTPELPKPSARCRSRKNAFVDIIQAGWAFYD